MALHNGVVSTNADARGTASTTPKARRYDATLRRRQAEESRRRILDAAATLFTERGWSVGMREIARAAGVSFETVYSHFGSKPRLFNQVLDIAVVGDDEPVALIDRPEFAAISRGTPRERAAAAARLVAGVNGRTVGLQRALREGAAAEPQLASRLDEIRQAQRQTVRVASAVVAGRDLTPVESDSVWVVITLEVYDLLIRSAGWSPARYEQWLTDTIVKLLSLEM